MALAASLVLAPPRTSQAQFDPATIGAGIAFISTLYDYYQKAVSIFGGAGPDLAAKLDQVQTNILNALATQRNQQWKAQAQQVFDNFKILGSRMAADPDNPRLWSSTIELSKGTINLYAQLVDDVTNHVSSDVDSNYQLAPMFNALVATHTGLNKMKEEIYPNFGATWSENNIYLQRAIRVDYELIGSEHYMCVPNVNPGAGLYIRLIGQIWGHGLDPSTHDAQAHSQLWSKLTNHDVAVGTWTDTGLVCSGLGGTGSGTYSLTTTEYCNPGKGTCTPSFFPGDPTGHCPAPKFEWPKTAADTTAGINTARAYADTTWFTPDPVVQLVTAGMVGIMTLGGGSEADDGSITLPVLGQATDPSVIEPACTSTSSLAYPLLDTRIKNTAVALSGAYQVEGDYTNFFPDSQQRLSAGTTITRASPLSVSPSRSYTLVVRYAQNHTSSGIVKVGLNRADTGAGLVTFSDTNFPPTPDSDWQLKRYDFNTNSAWPSDIYARLQWIGGQITYFDAVWIEQR